MVRRNSRPENHFNVSAGIPIGTYTPIPGVASVDLYLPGFRIGTLSRTATASNDGRLGQTHLFSQTRLGAFREGSKNEVLMCRSKGVGWGSCLLTLSDSVGLGLHGPPFDFMMFTSFCPTTYVFKGLDTTKFPAGQPESTFDMSWSKGRQGCRVRFGCWNKWGAAGTYCVHRLSRGLVLKFIVCF